MGQIDNKMDKILKPVLCGTVLCAKGEEDNAGGREVGGCGVRGTGSGGEGVAVEGVSGKGDV